MLKNQVICRTFFNALSHFLRSKYEFWKHFRCVRGRFAGFNILGAFQAGPDIELPLESKRNGRKDDGKE